MADKKIIAVVGSTGAQGGGLVEAILADPNGGFAARAITRDPAKDKAKAIAAKGGEVVQADLDDVESLKKAFAGAYGVYAVTNFWEHFSGEKEKTQAKNIADAAKAAGVQHVIWSTLEDTRNADAGRRQADADAPGEVPRAALRREGRSGRVLPGRAHHIPGDVVLLGQPLLVRSRARRRAPTASTSGRSRWATASWRASRSRTSGRSRTGSSRPASSMSARPSASSARP